MPPLLEDSTTPLASVRTGSAGIGVCGATFALCCLLVACAPPCLDDASGLHATQVREIRVIHTREDAIAAVSEAARRGWRVSIAGKRHSMGGQSFASRALVLDMTAFSRVLAVDPEARTVNVQSGATWDDLQRALNPQQLSVKVMQSSPIFTVGGSLGVNCHGRDPRFGPISGTVRGFRLLLADGSVRDVTRASAPDLFSHVLGGYGLFGVILDVDLEVADNPVCVMHAKAMPVASYPADLRGAVTNNPRAEIHYARLSVDPANFLEEAVSVTYERVSDRPEGVIPLAEERAEETQLARTFLARARVSPEGRAALWNAQKKATLDAARAGNRITRNNVMRPPINFFDRGDLSRGGVDLLQEYFVPVDSFVPFVGRLRGLCRAHDAVLLNATVRYLPTPEEEGALGYAREDSLAIVLYLHVASDEASLARHERLTRAILDAALALDGTYYLAYGWEPTRDQFVAAYPRAGDFLLAKRRFDPQGMFTSLFYERYIEPLSSSEPAP